jgi:hypothetical protein
LPISSSHRSLKISLPSLGVVVYKLVEISFERGYPFQRKWSGKTLLVLLSRKPNHL